MGGRAQKTKKGTVIQAETAADIMMDAVTRYVARHIDDGRPQTPEQGTLQSWADFKVHQKRLSKLLEQTAFIAGIMRGEVD